MAIRSRDELLELIRGRIGEDTSDEALAFIEDFSDTLTDYEDRISAAGDWKTKYDELDASWRKKYRDRFYSGTSGEDEGGPDRSGALPDDGIDETKALTYEALFETKEG